MRDVGRPTYLVRLRPNPRVDGIKALRAALKSFERRFGLQAVEVREEAWTPPAPEYPRQDAHRDSDPVS